MKNKIKEWEKLNPQYKLIELIEKRLTSTIDLLIATEDEELVAKAMELNEALSAFEDLIGLVSSTRQKRDSRSGRIN